MSYGHQALSILAAVWEAAGYPWSVRLKALLPDWLPWIRQHYRPSATVEQQLLGISARQIDRRLQAKKQAQRRRIYGRTKPGCLLKHQIPAKTDSWDVKTPGFAEMDLVSHSGNSGAGWGKRAPSPRPPCSGSWLHFECLYNLAYGYILRWLDARTADLTGKQAPSVRPYPKGASLRFWRTSQRSDQFAYAVREFE